MSMITNATGSHCDAIRDCSNRLLPFQKQNIKMNNRVVDNDDSNTTITTKKPIKQQEKYHEQQRLFCESCTDH